MADPPTLDPGAYRVTDGSAFDLSQHPTDDAEPWTKESAADRTAELNQRLAELQELLWVQGRSKLLVVLQAIDAGGKDGTIRNVFRGVNPAGVRVVGFKRPTEVELAHDPLWRVHAQVPADGELVVFNRSHYEDVLVARIFDLVPEERWRARYRHIVDFEHMLADEGTTIVKLFLHISSDEQRSRFEKRRDDATKRWKLEPADLEARKRWDDYQAAFTEAIARTAAPRAPWYVVPADRKWYRNMVVSRILVATLDGLDLAPPAPPPGVEDYVFE